MKYFSNTSWLLGEKILRIIVGLFVGVWVARYLGPEQYGLLNYAISFAALFTVVSGLGLDGIVIRELIKDQTRKDELLGTSFLLKLIGGFFSLVLLGFGIYFSNESENRILIFLVASGVIFQSFNVIDFYYQSKVQSKFVVYANMFSFLLSSTVKVVLIIKEAPLVYFAVVVLLDSMLLAAGFLFFYVKKNGDSQKSLLKWTFDGEVAKVLLKDSWPLMLSGIAITLYLKIDQVMIKNILGASDVGRYAAAISLSEVWFFIPMVISSSLFPAIVESKKTDEQLYQNRLQKLFKLVVFVAIAIAILMTLLSDFLISLLFGIEYQGAADILKIHIWAGVFISLGVASGKWLLVENMQNIMLWRVLTGMVVNVSLNIYLIPIYGLYGAASATLLGQMVAAYFFDLIMKETRVIFVMKSKALLFWRF